jgi:hypothetical protein
MGQPGLQPSNALGQTPSGLTPPSVRPNRLFVLIPTAGLIAQMTAVSVYRPLDRGPLFWLGFVLFFAAVFFASYVQQKSRRGEDVSSFFPMIYWLALGPALVGFVLWANGAMDHHPVESHRESVTRMFISNGRHGTSYHIEFTSWRSNRTTEKGEVSFHQYHQLHIDDPIIIDVHPGALGIAWIGAIRKADSP